MQNNEQITFRIEELEKRMALSNKSNNNNFKLEIQALQKKLQEVEHGIVNLSNDYNTFCANTNQGLESLETSLANLIIETTNLSNELTNLKTSLNTNEIFSKLNTLTEKVSNVEATVNSLTDDFNLLQNNVTNNSQLLTNLTARVSSVENSVQNMPIETFNFYDRSTIKSGRKAYGSNQIYSTIFFLCEPTSLLTLKFKTKINLSTAAESYSATMQYILNDDIIIKEIPVTTTGETSLDLEFTHEFYPTQKNNRIRMKMINDASVATNLCQMEYTIVEIWGRNIVMLNKDRDFKVFISKNHYYLTKNDIDSGKYKKIAVGETDIETGYTDFPVLMNPPTSGNITSIWHYNFTYLPYIVFDDTTSKYTIDNSDERFAAANSLNASVFVTQLSKVPLKHGSFTYAAALSDQASFSHPGELDKIMRNTCSVYHYHNHALAMSLSKYISGQATPRMKLNNVNIDKVFVYNTAVFAKDWEDNPNRPYYCVATDDLGINYFYNGKNATYSVNLGYGYQTNAFMQADGSINVYMRVLNNIIKKVLTFNNETEMYELTSETDLGTGWEFIEGYYNDYFINKFGTWQYVPQTTNN